MKTIAFLMATLVGLQCASVTGTACVPYCTDILQRTYEADCQEWREKLPRPALYNHCQDTYGEATTIACNMYCSESPSESQLDSVLLRVCDGLRGIPPNTRKTACASGYVKARNRAREAVKAYIAEGGSKTSIGGTDGGVDNIEIAQPKKVSVKRQLESHKNILEQARDEALLAFQDTKSTEL